MLSIMMLFLILLPVYFFIKGVRNRSNRKINLILSCLLSVPILLIGAQELGYHQLKKDLTKDAINLFKENYGIPQEEIIVIESMESRMKHNMTMEITTKKDFENWQERVEEKKQLLSGENVASHQVERLIKNRENCEITYRANYYVSGQKAYIFPYSKISYIKNKNNNKGVGTDVSTGENNLPDVIRLSKRQEETKRRLSEFYAYPPSNEEVKHILEQAQISDNRYQLDE